MSTHLFISFFLFLFPSQEKGTEYLQIFLPTENYYQKQGEIWVEMFSDILDFRSSRGRLGEGGGGKLLWEVGGEMVKEGCEEGVVGWVVNEIWFVVCFCCI